MNVCEVFFPDSDVLRWLNQIYNLLFYVKCLYMLCVFTFEYIPPLLHGVLTLPEVNTRLCSPNIKQTLMYRQGEKAVNYELTAVCMLGNSMFILYQDNTDRHQHYSKLDYPSLLLISQKHFFNSRMNYDFSMTLILLSMLRLPCPLVVSFGQTALLAGFKKCFYSPFIPFFASAKQRFFSGFVSVRWRR